MARRYRRRSRASAVIYDAVEISSRLQWQGALLLGVFGFFLFGVIVPNLLISYLEAQTDSRIYPIIEAIFERRIHWFGWIGITCLIVGTFFAIRNYLFGVSAGTEEEGFIRILAKVLGRRLD
jgi:drug/metabolite transporter (DMT)-like permease